MEHRSKLVGLCSAHITMHCSIHDFQKTLGDVLPNELYKLCLDLFEEKFLALKEQYHVKHPIGYLPGFTHYNSSEW